MKTHRVADLFPEMTTHQFQDLVEDIKKNGQIEAILTYKGRIADGKHRYKACRRLKIEPKIVKWEDIRPSAGTSLVAYVISRNLQRRHMTKEQRTGIARKALPLFQAEAAARKKEGSERGGEARRKAAQTKGKVEKSTSLPADLQEGSPRNPPKTNNKKGEGPASVTEQSPPKKSHENEAAAQAAKQSGVSTRDVYRANAIARASEELAALMESGQIPLALADKIAKLRPRACKAVVAKGQKTGDYRAAYNDYVARTSKKSNGDPSIAQRELGNTLRQAIRKAESLHQTLEAACLMAKPLDIERGPGLEKLVKLTEGVASLAKQIVK